MKKLFALMIITLISISNYGQEFEGKITYSIHYKSKNKQVSGQHLTSMMGSKQEYYIKGGSYKSDMNGSFMQWQLYINKDNKLYNKFSNSEVFKWSDGLAVHDPISDVELNKDVVEILGYTCDEIIFTTKNGVHKYYFNNELKVNVALYENHKFGNWYEYLKLSKSLPLKTIFDNNQFTVVSVATEVTSMKLKSTDFELPKNAKTQKAQY
jgi:hypothetical protein